MTESKSIDGLCDIFSVSVMWDKFFDLRYLARGDASAKEKYELVLRTLVSLEVFSYDAKGHYTIERAGCEGGGCYNPKLDDKLLYIVKEEDKDKILGVLPPFAGAIYHSN